MKLKFRTYYQVRLTGTWMPMNLTFISKKEAQSYVKTIKLGITIYRDDLKYKVKEDK